MGGLGGEDTVVDGWRTRIEVGMRVEAVGMVLRRGIVDLVVCRAGSGGGERGCRMSLGMVVGTGVGEGLTELELGEWRTPRTLAAARPGHNAIARYLARRTILDKEGRSRHCCLAVQPLGLISRLLTTVMDSNCTLDHASHGSRVLMAKPRFTAFDAHDGAATSAESFAFGYGQARLMNKQPGPPVCRSITGRHNL